MIAYRERPVNHSGVPSASDALLPEPVPPEAPLPLFYFSCTNGGIVAGCRLSYEMGGLSEQAREGAGGLGTGALTLGGRRTEPHLTGCFSSKGLHAPVLPVITVVPGC
jgi:hypothetical protein